MINVEKSKKVKTVLTPSFFIVKTLKSSELSKLWQIMHILPKICLLYTLSKLFTFFNHSRLFFRPLITFMFSEPKPLKSALRTSSSASPNGSCFAANQRRVSFADQHGLQLVAQRSIPCRQICALWADVIELDEAAVLSSAADLYLPSHSSYSLNIDCNNSRRVAKKLTGNASPLHDVIEEEELVKLLPSNLLDELLVGESDL